MSSNKGAEAWVAVDPLYGATRRFLEMGFGESLQRPCVWPGSKIVASREGEIYAAVAASALPMSVQPKMEAPF